MVETRGGDGVAAQRPTINNTIIKEDRTMAHMLESARDIAYAGKTPWHGLGTSMPAAADLDQWRIAAGLDWTAEKRQAYFSLRTQDQFGNPKNTPEPVEDRWALVRSDSQRCLGLVSTRYHVVQPKQVIEFYRDLSETAGFTLETAGCLAGGKRIWALAKTPNSLRIKGQDQIDGYLLLATSYDGTMSTQARFTSVRVVCQNTLSLSLRDSSDNFISVPHNTQFDADRIKAKLGIAGETWSQFEEVTNKLAETAWSEEAAVEYFHRVLGDSAFSLRGGKLQPTAKTKQLFNLVANGRGSELRSAQGTYWGLVNAVTEYVDHHSGTKATRGAAVHGTGSESRSKAQRDNRLNSAWFGTGAATKRKALQVAMEMADIQVAA